MVQEIRERSSRTSKPVFLDAEDDEADETAGTNDEGNAVYEEIIVESVSGNESSGPSSSALVCL